LQTLLIPQDPRNFRAERANSLFDQRHRFVFSGVLASPIRGASERFSEKIFIGFYNRADYRNFFGSSVQHHHNVDANNDQSSSNRPTERERRRNALRSRLAGRLRTPL
jgi:hypothetical protein